ncbi:hypothetical protein BJ742DRAFT_913497 [Cladochytrium replicatum]|nr:hypothetical protein BJ742DRAFT_913497 [Cladochytrium replicatum]
MSDFVSGTDANDTVIPTFASQLMKMSNGTVLDLSNFKSTLEFNIAISGELWLFSSTTLKVPTENSKLYFVAAVARKDFSEKIDATQRTIMLIIIGIIGVTTPLRRLTVEMEKVANFDFSMLDRGFFVENSMFLEVRKMQKVFNLMLKGIVRCGFARDFGKIIGSKEKKQNGSGSQTKPSQTKTDDQKNIVYTH